MRGAFRQVITAIAVPGLATTKLLATNVAEAVAAPTTRFSYAAGGGLANGGGGGAFFGTFQPSALTGDGQVTITSDPTTDECLGGPGAPPPTTTIPPPTQTSPEPSTTAFAPAAHAVVTSPLFTG